MISDETKKYLASLVYSKDAQRIGSIMPLGGIYWKDEIPDFPALRQLPDHVKGEIYRIIRIRYDLWDDKELSPEDIKFLEFARLQVPDCPIFQRLVLSEDDRLAQKSTRGELSDIHEMMAERSETTEMEMNKDGTVSTTWRI
jgi:hypothetical protein